MQNILRVDGFHSISKGVSFVLPKSKTFRSRVDCSNACYTIRNIHSLYESKSHNHRDSINLILLDRGLTGEVFDGVFSYGTAFQTKTEYEINYVEQIC